MFNGGYTRQNMFDLKLEYQSFLNELVHALLAEHPGDLPLVPYTYAGPGNVESDDEACRLLRGSLSEDMRGRVRHRRNGRMGRGRWVGGNTLF